MKRDMDVVRDLLLRTEAANGSVSIRDSVETYHVRIMIDGRLVEGRISEEITSDAPRDSYIHNLTWAGHDFLDAARDEGLWQRAREKFLKPATSWTFSILLEWLKAEIRSRIPGL